MIQNIDEARKSKELLVWPDSENQSPMPENLREVYERYVTGTNPVRQAAIYQGVPGLLLTADYSQKYVQKWMGAELATPAIMEQAYYELLAHAAVMNSDMGHDTCVFLVGRNSSQVGHELCLFIPASVGDILMEDFITFFENRAYARTFRYLVLVKKQYVDAKMLVGNPDSQEDNWVSASLPLMLGFFTATDEDHAILLAIRKYRNLYDLNAEALTAIEV